MNEAKQVIVFPRGQLAAKDKERLTKHGVIVVEADDPSKVVTILPSAPIATGDDILLAALAGLGAKYGEGHQTFGRVLGERIKARVDPMTDPAPIPSTPAPSNTPK